MDPVEPQVKTLYVWKHTGKVNASTGCIDTNIAIKKGRELAIIKWKHIPYESVGLELKEIQPNKEIEAKKAVTFNLGYLIDNFPNNSSVSGYTVGCIQSITYDYDINNFTERKLKEKLAKATHIDNQSKSFISEELNKIRQTHLLKLEWCLFKNWPIIMILCEITMFIQIDTHEQIFNPNTMKFH